MCVFVDVMRLFTAEIPRKNSRMKRIKAGTKSAVKEHEIMPRGGDRRLIYPILSIFFGGVP